MIGTILRVIVGNSLLNNFKSAVDNYFYDYRFMLM